MNSGENQSTFSFQDPLISADKAYEEFQKNSAVFVDIRDPNDFANVHIPDARNINEIFTYLSTSTEEGIKDIVSTFENLFRNAGINGDEHVIVYEENPKTRFGASARAYYLLSLLGHKNVSILNGGLEAWSHKGYPVTKEVKEHKKGSFTAQWTGEIFASKDEIKQKLNESNTVLVDVRDMEEWTGESSSPYGKDFAPRKGRIPGAVHLLWKDLMKTEDSVTYFKDPKEIQDLCNPKGITNDKEIIVYCFKGARSSNTFLNLKRAGFEKVKNYFGSWNEWSRDPSLPIDDKVLS